MAKLQDIPMHLHVETAQAVLVSDDGDRENAVWLAKSQIEMEVQKDGTVIVTMPEWLATERGLV